MIRRNTHDKLVAFRASSRLSDDFDEVCHAIGTDRSNALRSYMLELVERHRDLIEVKE